MELDKKDALRKLFRLIQDLVDLGAAFIRVTCAKRGINMSQILQHLLQLIDLFNFVRA